MPFRFANVSGRSVLVDEDDSWYDLERITAGGIAADPMKALVDGSALHAANEGLSEATPDGSLADASLGAPVPAPRNAFGVGLNYRNHAAESNMELPKNPLVFTKFTSCIVGPFADVELRSATGDYEAELVFDTSAPTGTILGTWRADLYGQDAGQTPVVAGTPARLAFTTRGRNLPLTLLFTYTRNADMQIRRVTLRRIK